MPKWAEVLEGAAICGFLGWMANDWMGLGIGAALGTWLMWWRGKR